ncbi:MAG: methylenetetrahydrofolate reductase [NAD(P)H] [Terrimicrobiaceae bacterium]
MHINDIFFLGKTTFSFEFFPPKTDESTEALFDTIVQLEPLAPNFVSVTYGAGGSTRERTHDLVVRLKTTTNLDPIPHLTCIGHTLGDIEEILSRYAKVGVGNLLALRGDPPRGGEAHDHSRDVFPNAIDLVRAIRAFNEKGIHPDPRGFGIGVAGFPEGHPSTPNRLLEMDYLKAKVDAGADYICTQLFFDNHDFYDFRERCALAGINAPIVAGLMPVTSLSGLRRMADLAGGTRFPARLLKALARAGDDAEAVRRVGIHYATEQASDLLDHGVAGIHFYTLNQSSATKTIYANLGFGVPEEPSPASEPSPALT